MQLLLATMIFVASLICFLLLHRTVLSVTPSPDGRYLQTISYRSYLSHLGMMPGSSSDKPGFVKITGIDGTDYGEIPVPMLHMADVNWSASSAEIRLIGEWDFIKRTCFYWSEDGAEKIYVQ